MSTVTASLPTATALHQRLTERLAPTHLQASVATGQLYNGKSAVAAGYLDRVVEPDQVVEAALQEAAELASTLDLASYALTIKALRRGTIELMS